MSELDQAIARSYEALKAFATRDPAGVMGLFSRADDVVLANPFGPAVRGRDHARERLSFASSRMRDGDVSEEM